MLDREDAIELVLDKTASDEWREVILLALGKLSIDGRERTTQMVKRIAESKKELTPFHNLVLAVEALRDVGNAVDRGVADQIRERVKRELSRDRSTLSKMFGKLTAKTWVEEKNQLTEALVRVGAGYWTLPHGEPEWISIPAGKFWMGSGSECHRVHVDQFLISKVPITNAQYLLYVQATGAEMPNYWENELPPRGLYSHPVVNVSWHDAVAYCDWLGRATGKTIRLPSEAEWEKAARGDKDKREFPWGDSFDSTKCNGLELGIVMTTAVGIFSTGASPYGVLDMRGNVWEWTRSKKRDYPYNPDDGRENVRQLNEKDWMVLRGGSFFNESHKEWSSSMSHYRDWGKPEYKLSRYGFRVVASPFRL